jgi:hypothetical protein
MMKHWLSQLQRVSETRRAEEQALREQRAATQTKAARERLTPLQHRLDRLLATIPVELQRDGLSLSALQASLSGRRRATCHPGELGTALRRLGFERQRNWRGADGFRAVWRKH